MPLKRSSTFQSDRSKVPEIAGASRNRSTQRHVRFSSAPSIATCHVRKSLSHHMTLRARYPSTNKVHSIRNRGSWVSLSYPVIGD